VLAPPSDMAKLWGIVTQHDGQTLWQNKNVRMP